MARPYKRELEYLESTGTQYIDSGWYLQSSSNTFEISTSFIPSSTQKRTYCGLCGVNASNGAESKNYCVIRLRDSYTDSINCKNGDTDNPATFTYTGKFNVVAQYDGTGKTTWTVNGSSQDKQGTLTYLPAASLYIFGIRFSPDIVGSSNFNISAKLYHYTIKENDVLVRDFIPVLDNNDTPCMYDRVSKQLFYNQGTGEFLYGEKPEQTEIYSPIPYKMNPFGMPFSNSIYRYAANAEMFLDGIDNVGAGTLDTSATVWKDLTGHEYDASKFGTYGPLWATNGGLQGSSNQRVLQIANGQKTPLHGARQFTIELAFSGINSSASAWWLNNRRPWNTSSTKGFQLTTHASNAINFGLIRGTTSITPRPSVVNAYLYRTCTIVYTGTHCYMYMDGVRAEDELNIEVLPLSAEEIANTPFLINGTVENAYSISNKNQRIFAVRVWRRALTEAEILNNVAIDAQRFNL